MIRSEEYIADVNIAAQEKLDWEALYDKTVFIAGASGLLGTAIVDILMARNAAGNQINIIATGRSKTDRFDLYNDNTRFEFLRCDVNLPVTIKTKADYIIHAASNTHPTAYSIDPIGTITSNVIGTHNLLQYGIDFKIRRFVFLSSVEIYGVNRGDCERFDESYCGFIDCNTVRAGYPESKRIGEALCNSYCQKYGLDFVVPRLSRLYGPTMRNSDSKALMQFIRNAAEGKDIVLKSLGAQRFSYCYVVDAALAVLTTMLTGTPREAYNVADHESESTLADLAKNLAKLAGTNVVFDVPDVTESRGYSPAKLALLDATKLYGLGWQPRTRLADGLRKTVRMIRL